MTSLLGPAVSVIIPALNAAEHVGCAVESALASAGVALEIIVIDDGSTDGTREVLESFGDRIRVVQQHREGAYRARNRGAALARGAWLAFLDADDLWSPEKLRVQLAAAHDAVDLIYTDRDNFGDTSRTKTRQSDSVRLWDGNVFEPLLLGNFVTLSSVLMRKSRFEALGGFAVDLPGVQDWDLWLRHAGSGGLVHLCREPLTYYRLHPGQMSNDLVRRASDRERVLRRALTLPAARGLRRSTVRRAFASIWLIGAWHAEPGEPWRAVRWYCRAAAYWPWDQRPYRGVVRSLLRR